MTDPCPPLALAGRQRKGVELAYGVGLPEHIVIDAGHKAGRRLRDYAFFDNPDDPRSALLIECGQHWERNSPRIAMQATLRFLRHFGMAPPDFLAARLEPSPLPAQRAIEITDVVTIDSEDFHFVISVAGLDVVVVRPVPGLQRDASFPDRSFKRRCGRLWCVVPVTAFDRALDDGVRCGGERQGHRSV